MNKLNGAVLLFVLLLAQQAFAQEIESDLTVDPDVILCAERERNFESRERGGGSLTLPFWDDFSRYSLPTNDPDIPLSWQRWEDNSARISCSLPVQPPTYGVATLDGLMGNGYPYDFICGDCQGPADTLTSLPIDLSGLSADNDVYLMFFYQAGGRGNEPDPNDSLVLEFYMSGIDQWITKWSTPGMDLAPFEQVIVQVDDTTIFGNTYFENDFRFRFRNYATLGGNVDHWHIDYVTLNENVDPENTELEDLAYMDCEYTLLTEFSAMPWTHFKENPNLYTSDQVTAAQRNLSFSDFNFQSGFRVEYEDQVWDYPNDYSNTSGNANSVISPETYYDIPDGVYDTSVNDTCAIFTVKHYHEITDGFPQNDTISFEQNFTNYYAYDDGSAERAYSLNEPGGKIALRYNLAKTDSLLGLFIHFTPFIIDQSLENFLLRAWQSSGSTPGEEIGENFGFHSAQYFDWGYDKFAYYEYDEPMEVSGSIFVGFVQDSNAELSVGNDKNSNANTAHLYYQLGLGAPWTASEITGSLMIRPVFKSGKTNVWNDIFELNETSFIMYPNPANDQVVIVPEDLTSQYDLSIFDSSGRLVTNESSLRGETRHSLSDVMPGVYIVEFADESGVVRSRLIRQ